MQVTSSFLVPSFPSVIVREDIGLKLDSTQGKQHGMKDLLHAQISVSFYADPAQKVVPLTFQLSDPTDSIIVCEGFIFRSISGFWLKYKRIIYDPCMMHKDSRFWSQALGLVSIQTETPQLGAKQGVDRQAQITYNSPQ